MRGFFDEPRHAGLHVLIPCINVFDPRNYVRDFTSIFMKIKEFDPRNYVRDFTSIFMKIKEFNKPHKDFSLRRTTSTLKAKIRGERSSLEKEPFRDWKLFDGCVFD